ncbi:MAG: hypothetical protein WDN26_15785 [Chitinophagaceae bacterium]
MRLPLLLISGFIILSISSFSQSANKYSKVQISIPKSGVSKLQDKGMDFDHGIYNDEQNTFTVSLSAHDVAILKNCHINSRF